MKKIDIFCGGGYKWVKYLDDSSHSPLPLIDLLCPLTHPTNPTVSTWPLHPDGRNTHSNKSLSGFPHSLGTFHLVLALCSFRVRMWTEIQHGNLTGRVLQSEPFFPPLGSPPKPHRNFVGLSTGVQLPKNWKISISSRALLGPTLTFQVALHSHKHVQSAIFVEFVPEIEFRHRSHIKRPVRQCLVQLFARLSPVRAWGK